MKYTRSNTRSNNFNPMIFEKTRDGEIVYDVYSRLAKDRIIFLSEDINDETGSTIAATLLFLDHQNKDKTIKMYINSVGGNVNGGLFTIYDTMQNISAPIETICIGQGYSAAAVLLASGSPGLRKAYENAYMMIHEIQVGEMSGPASEIAREAKRIEMMNERCLQIIVNHTGQSLQKVQDDCKNDMYFTAQEALEYGLIDSIIRPAKSKTNSLKAKSKKNSLKVKKNRIKKIIDE